MKGQKEQNDEDTALAQILLLFKGRNQDHQTQMTRNTVVEVKPNV